MRWPAGSLRWLLLAAVLLGVSLAGGEAFAQSALQDNVPAVDRAMEDLTGAADTVTGEEVSTAVRMVMIFTAMTFLPAMVLVMTPFTRFVIVFSLLRQALCPAAIDSLELVAPTHSMSTAVGGDRYRGFRIAAE